MLLVVVVEFPGISKPQVRHCDGPDKEEYDGISGKGGFLAMLPHCKIPNCDVFFAFYSVPIYFFLPTYNVNKFFLTTKTVLQCSKFQSFTAWCCVLNPNVASQLFSIQLQGSGNRCC